MIEGWKRTHIPFHLPFPIPKRIFPYRTNLQLTATFLANQKIAADSSKLLGDCILYVVWQVQKVHWKISEESIS